MSDADEPSETPAPTSVSGGASGIGRAVCASRARDGGRVTVDALGGRVDALATPAGIVDTTPFLEMLSPKPSYVRAEPLTLDGGMMMD